jgi:hypothetical protein
VRGTAVREIVTRERVHECGVNALRLKDIQQFADVSGLLIFIAREVALQTDWPGARTPLND